MLSIGELARYARVSVRMLRHCDHLGLLTPAHVDPRTGYRSYRAAQVTQLHRLVALKDLGFRLDQIRPILVEEVGVDELRGMLRLRQAQLAAQIDADTVRLAEVERRLRSIDKEHAMSEHEYVVKPLPAMRVAQLSASVSSQPEIGPVIGPMFDQLARTLPGVGITLTGPSLATYTMTDDGIDFTAGFPVGVDSVGVDGVEVSDLPAHPRAATVMHHGRMDTVGDTWQGLHAWIEANGHTPTGLAREYYLETPMDRPDEWVTELQQPLA